MLIIADANIANVTDFFNNQTFPAIAPIERDVQVITMAGRAITAEVLAEYQPDVLLIRSITPVNETLLKDNKSVWFVGSATVGTDHVDTDYLARRGIEFANAMGCSKHSVAQYVITAILNLRPDYVFQPITLGIIGLGNIGSTLAQYAIAFGWQVLGYDPLLPRSVTNNSTLDKVLTQSNVISFHVPLTFEKNSSYPTHHKHLMTTKRWDTLPETTIVINTARGEVLANADIISHPNVTVLDVFEHEPQVEAELLQCVSIATPHIAGYTLEGKLRGTQMIYEALCKKLGVEPALNFHDFLPPQMPLFEKLHIPLKDHERQQVLNRLPSLYDIRADDQRLRAVAGADGVSAKEFDDLRKNYPLRRELLAYGFKL